jgi:flagellar biosynthesis/type III secretory pathway chaperone
MAAADGVRPADVQRHIERILNEEARLLGSLEQLLRSEADILRGDDVDAIEHIGSARHQCIDALTGLEAERAEACRLLASGSGREGFEKLLDWCDPARSLRARWLANLDCARRCKDLNDRNGAVVSARLNRVQHLLAQLRGASPPSTYGPRAAAGAAMLGYRDLGCA